jgi:hypothetical protein
VVQYVEAVTLANAALTKAEAITRKQERDAPVLLEMVTRIAKERGDPVHNRGGLNIQPLLPLEGDEAVGNVAGGLDTDDEDFDEDEDEFDEDEELEEGVAVAPEQDGEDEDETQDGEQDEGEDA